MIDVWCEMGIADLFKDPPTFEQQWEEEYNPKAPRQVSARVLHFDCDGVWFARSFAAWLQSHPNVTVETVTPCMINLDVYRGTATYIRGYIVVLR
jgi:hypothetical protein